jgi:hypothetical protein
VHVSTMQKILSHALSTMNKPCVHIHLNHSYINMGSVGVRYGIGFGHIYIKSLESPPPIEAWRRRSTNIK